MKGRAIPLQREGSALRKRRWRIIWIAIQNDNAHRFSLVNVNTTAFVHFNCPLRVYLRRTALRDKTKHHKNSAHVRQHDPTV
jgi:hypothetical protein